MNKQELSQRHNGYTNYPTFMIALMLNNERECYDKILKRCDFYKSFYPLHSVEELTRKLARYIEGYFNNLPAGVVDYKWYKIWSQDFKDNGIFDAIYESNPLPVDWLQIAREFEEFLQEEN